MSKLRGNSLRKSRGKLQKFKNIKNVSRSLYQSPGKENKPMSIVVKKNAHGKPFFEKQT